MHEVLIRSSATRRFAANGACAALLLLGCGASQGGPADDSGTVDSDSIDAGGDTPGHEPDARADGAPGPDAPGVTDEAGRGDAEAPDAATDAADTRADATGWSPPDASVCAMGVTGPTGTPPALTQGQWANITPPGLDLSTDAYGCSRLALDPCRPYTMYVCVDQQGIYKTTDGGATWARLGTPPASPDYGPSVTYLDSPLDVKIDPSNPEHLYAVQGVRGTTLGFWVSEDGGRSWTKPAGFVSGEQTTWTNDVYWMSVDPTDFGHVLLSFHSPWANSQDSGVLETKDGGATWTPHFPGGWGAGLAVNFLYNPALGIGDSKTWLVGTQWAGGFYRTSDGGGTWKNVTAQSMMHGGTGIYYATNGVLYSGADAQIMRSTDNGVTWTLVGPSFADGYYKVIGDGKSLYAQEANTGGNSTGPQPYITSAETDGTTWTMFSTQTFSDGPFDMAYDGVDGIIYSSNWRGGVWALKVP
jgi:photosystem II stability/assembly factor-like uncharacterized protein